MVLGRAPITLAQVRGRLEPKSWLDNTFWDTRGYWPTQPAGLHFDFVITDGLDMHWLEERLGVPRAKHSCFGDEIWVYDRPADVQFRNYLLSYAAGKTGDHDAWWEADRFVSDRVDKRYALAFEGERGALVRLPSVPQM